MKIRLPEAIGVEQPFTLDQRARRRLRPQGVVQHIIRMQAEQEQCADLNEQVPIEAFPRGVIIFHYG